MGEGSDTQMWNTSLTKQLTAVDLQSTRFYFVWLSALLLQCCHKTVHAEKENEMNCEIVSYLDDQSGRTLSPEHLAASKMPQLRVRECAWDVKRHCFDKSRMTANCWDPAMFFKSYLLFAPQDLVSLADGSALKNKCCPLREPQKTF